MPPIDDDGLELMVEETVGEIVGCDGIELSDGDDDGGTVGYAVGMKLIDGMELIDGDNDGGSVGIILGETVGLTVGAHRFPNRTKSL